MKFKKISVSKYRYWLLAVFFLGMLLQIFFTRKVADWLVLLLIGLLILSLRLIKLKENILIFMGLFLVALCPFFLLINQTPKAEKIAIWAFIFLLIGNVLKIYGFYKDDKKN